MSDAQNVPVFLRHIDAEEPQFLGRFPLGELAQLGRAIADHGCFTGEDTHTGYMTQFICYENGTTHTMFVGYEFIIEPTV